MKDSILPDCMMPDGAEPCKAYLAKCQEVEELRENRSHYVENYRTMVKAYGEEEAKNIALQSKVTDLEAKAKRYEAALEFYADRKNWQGIPISSNPNSDFVYYINERNEGDQARQALKEQAGEKGEGE